MKRTRHSHASRGAASAACAAVLLLASGCGRDDPAAQRLAVARQAVEQCSGTDTHTKHINRFACETCHPKGGEFGFSGTLPSGTAVSGTVTRVAGVPPSCTVTCHGPEGGPQPVAWDAGPMTCGSCHPGAILVAGGSAHAPGGDRAMCEGCHDLGQHMSGLVRLVNGMQPGTEEMCLTCHSGTGGTLGGDAGPLLVGWQDPAGDWHGARAGAGFGGILDAPYARGQAPLLCTVCHDAHASGSAFLFARTVNGMPLTQERIGRAGVGAERLCDACHEGERHAQCAACHGTDPQPAGSACFKCHGHEGLRLYPAPGGSAANYHDQSNGGDCSHCHDAWLGSLDTVPPQITATGVLVSAVNAGGATISWDTDERASGYVEYGVTARGTIRGSAALAMHHEVTLSGLAENTTYAFRVVSSDAARNVTRSAVFSFTTAPSNAPLAPVLVHTYGQSGYADELTFVMRWNPVTAPDGDPVEYRMVLAEYPTFAGVIIDTGWISQTSYTATLSTWSPLGTYYWHVMARDAVHDVWSPWSSVDSFYSWDSRE